MEKIYLDFEKPLEEIQEQINKTKEVGEQGKVDVSATLEELSLKLEETTKETNSEILVYSDAKMEAIRAFGLDWKVDDALFSKYKDKYKLDLEEWSGEQHHSLPVPAVFVVKDGVVATPILDQQILPGISRHVVIESLRVNGSIQVEERVVTMDEVHKADEVWITNSSKHIGPVVELDGEPEGDGLVGHVWEKAMTIYEAAKYDF